MKISVLIITIALITSVNASSQLIHVNQQDQPIIIGSDTDLTNSGFPGKGSEASPYVISGLNLFPVAAGIQIENTTFAIKISNNNIDGGDFGIYIKNSTGKVVIEENQMVHGNQGIYVRDSSNIQLIGNIIKDNSDDGIHFLFSSSFNISNNILDNNDMGCRIENSQNGKVENNTLTKQKRDGIRVLNSNDLTLFHNRILLNTQDGLRIAHGLNIKILENFVVSNTDGIRIDNSSLLKVDFNQISSNTEKGLRFQFSNNSIIRTNYIADNTQEGLRFYDQTFGAVIYNNVFLKNNGADVGERDDSATSGNIWYNASRKHGNYYETYDNRPYKVKGDAGAIDEYPLQYVPDELVPFLTNTSSGRIRGESTESNIPAINYYLILCVGIISYFIIAYVLLPLLINPGDIIDVMKYFGIGDFFANIHSTRHLVNRLHHALSINSEVTSNSIVLAFAAGLRRIKWILSIVGFFILIVWFNYFGLFFYFILGYIIMSVIGKYLITTPIYSQIENSEVVIRRESLSMLMEITESLIDDVEYLEIAQTNFTNRSRNTNLIDSKTIGRKTKLNYEINNFNVIYHLLNGMRLMINHNITTKEKYKTKKGSTNLIDFVETNYLVLTYIVRIEKAGELFDSDASDYETVIQKLTEKTWKDLELFKLSHRFKLSKNFFSITFNFPFQPDQQEIQIQEILLNTFEVVTEFNKQFIPRK